MKLWGGRFEKKIDELAQEFTASLSFDRRLFREDIEVSLAHSTMLAKTGIIGEEEAEKIKEGLTEIRTEIEKEKFEFKPTDEDIHTAIERRLIEKIGPLGGKLRTARSRNDQVVTDMRLYIKKEIKEIGALMASLQGTLIDVSEKDGLNTIMPGYSHLQKAQPILLAHHLMAYFYMLERDMRRLKCCYKQVDSLPLGAGALAGTTFSIDRQLVAKELGFSKVAENSLDAVADRDFVIEFLSTCSLIMLHLSRFAEELILWTSTEFGFAEIDDAYATGSSIMPQKKNPDVAELIRGKSGRVFGHLMALLTTLKGLPLAYNKDLQEDKEGLFETIDIVKVSLKLFEGIIATIKFNQARMQRAAEENFATATDAAEYLAAKGMPFREAHEVVGKLVKYCLGKNLSFIDLDLETFKDFSPLFDRDILDVIRVRRAVERRQSEGGTSPERVTEQITKAKKLLTAEKDWLKKIS